MPHPAVVPLLADGMAMAAGYGAFNKLHNYYRQGMSRPSAKISVRSRNRAMPRTASRTMRKRRRGRRRRGIIRRRVPRTLMPREKVIRCKAVYPVTSAGTSGNLIAQGVSMFDITDPFGGATNVQPLGYDQWKGLYNKACVLGLKVTARVHNKGSAAVMCGITLLPENQGNTTLSVFEHYMELPTTITRLLSPDVDHCVLVSKVNVRKHMHLRNLRDEDAFHVDLDGETAPTRQAYVHAWVQPIDKSTTNAFEMVVTAEYLVRLFDSIVPARSTDT